MGNFCSGGSPVDANVGGAGKGAPGKLGSKRDPTASLHANLLGQDKADELWKLFKKGKTLGAGITGEVIEATRPNVIKTDGKTEPFEPNKVLKSLRLACSKRPIELTVLTDFVQSLDAQVSTGTRRSIATSEVGDRILAFLRSVDPVAYVRYASVYRSFSDVDEFIDELRILRAEDGAEEE